MQILRILILLILIQASRAGVTLLLQKSYEPAMIYSDFLLIITGAALYFLFKPDKKSLGLDFNNKSKATRILYIFTTVIAMLLFLSSLILFSGNSLESIAMSVKGVLLYPIFEELLFRGCLWDKLKKNRWKDY